MSETPRCATCGRSIYWSGRTDHVGRQTSEGAWTHYDHALNDEHTPKLAKTMTVGITTAPDGQSPLIQSVSYDPEPKLIEIVRAESEETRDE